MSPTLDELVADGLLIPWHPSLGPRRHSKRRLFVTKEFAEWAGSLDAERQRHTLLGYAQELQTIAADFVAGERIVTFMHRVDPPKGEGLMRLNTTSFRLVGWCAAPQVLILGLGAKAIDTHGPGKKLTLLGKAVVALRRKMGVVSWETGEFYDLFRYQA